MCLVLSCIVLLHSVIRMSNEFMRLWFIDLHYEVTSV